MLKVKIDGVVYENVGKIEDIPKPSFYYDKTALDGTKIRDFHYTKTDRRVQFYNSLNPLYYENLKTLIETKQAQNESVVCGIPNNADGFDEAEYLLSIDGGEINKGYLSNGNFYRTGLTVYMEKVYADD